MQIELANLHFSFVLIIYLKSGFMSVTFKNLLGIYPWSRGTSDDSCCVGSQRINAALITFVRILTCLFTLSVDVISSHFFRQNKLAEIFRVIVFENAKKIFFFTGGRFVFIIFNIIVISSWSWHEMTSEWRMRSDLLVNLEIRFCLIVN